MKHLISIFILLSSTILYAQNNRPLDTMNLNNEKKPINSQGNNNPAIPVTPTIRTTVTNQPPSIPNSNTHPTTGAVISIKNNKNISKENKPPATASQDNQLLLNRTDTALNRNRPVLQKQSTKKKKVAGKKGN